METINFVTWALTNGHIELDYLQFVGEGTNTEEAVKKLVAKWKEEQYKTKVVENLVENYL